MVSTKAFFEIVRDDPARAAEMVRQDPSLALRVSTGDESRIAGSTALHWAAHDGAVDLVRALLDAGADVNADQADWWVRPVDWAADAGRSEAVALLIERGADVSGDEWSNATPLHACAQGGSSNGKDRPADYAKTAEVLIAGGVEINAVATYGGQEPRLTPLDDAIRVGNEAVAEVLRAHGAMNA